MQVTKSSGLTEAFDAEKLRRSLRRSGADDVIIEQILEDLEGQWYEGISTKSIFKRAFKMLKRRHRPAAARYTLKQAMFDFGPSGFPFEDFFAEVLKSLGYQVQVRQLLPGVCVQHEMDVIAENADTLIWVECKYHPMAGSVSNIKIPLYIHSRFRDLEQYWEKNQAGKKSQKIEGWIVTNTRFFRRCNGLRTLCGNASGGLELPRKRKSPGIGRRGKIAPRHLSYPPDTPGKKQAA